MEKNFYLQEIDRILENVYSINESLVDSSTNAFILGFRSTLNKSYKYNMKINESSDLFEKGKKMAGELLDGISKFLKEVMKSISEGMKEAKNYIRINVGKFFKFISITFNELFQDFNDLLKKVKDESVELKHDIKKSFEEIYNQTISEIEELVKDTIKTKEDFLNWYRTNKTHLKIKFERLRKDTSDELKELSKLFSEFLSEGKESIMSVSKKTYDDFSLIYYTLLAGLLLNIENISNEYNEIKDIISEFLKPKIDKLRHKVGDYLEKASKDIRPEKPEYPDYVVKPKYSELKDDWVDKQKEEEKNIKPGQGTRKRLRREAEDKLWRGESYVIKDFKNFLK
jgi:hypothetical protein